MSQLLEGKTALILGVANRWSLAYAIARAFIRENAEVILTYQGDRQKQTVEELALSLIHIWRARATSCARKSIWWARLKTMLWPRSSIRLFRPLIRP